MQQLKLFKVEQFYLAIKSDLTVQQLIIFEPSKKKLCWLWSKIVEDATLQRDHDSFASEHGARMTAMHKATDNATDLKWFEIDL
jgi:F-type H+-transporting ATPase subunit gamma